jgi:hypothetical protein
MYLDPDGAIFTLCEINPRHKQLFLENGWDLNIYFEYLRRKFREYRSLNDYEKKVSHDKIVDDYRQDIFRWVEKHPNARLFSASQKKRTVTLTPAPDPTDV